MAKDKDIEAVRRKQLNSLIKQRFKSISEFATKLGINKTNVATLLRGLRPFTEFTANKIETTFGLPPGYLSNEDDQQYILTDFIDVRLYEDIKNVLNLLFEKRIKIATQICDQFKIQGSDGLIATKMNDELMYPTINKDELIIIDTSETDIEENKIYLFEINGLYKIRRLGITGKDMVTLHIDNENEKKKYITSNMQLSDIKILGKVVGGIKSYN